MVREDIVFPVDALTLNQPAALAHEGMQGVERLLEMRVTRGNQVVGNGLRSEIGEGVLQGLAAKATRTVHDWA